MIRCPNCNYHGTPVYETRGHERSRKCVKCLFAFNTLETAICIDGNPLTPRDAMQNSLRLQVRLLTDKNEKLKREIKTLRQKVRREREPRKPRSVKTKLEDVPVPQDWANSLMSVPSFPLDRPRTTKDETGWDNLDDVESKVHVLGW